MNSIQNYEMKNYQVGFKAKANKVISKAKALAEKQMRYKELNKRLNEINDIENTIIKERGFSYTAYYMTKLNAEVDQILKEMAQIKKSR